MQCQAYRLKKQKILFASVYTGGGIMVIARSCGSVIVGGFEIYYRYYYIVVCDAYICFMLQSFNSRGSIS